MGITAKKWVITKKITGLPTAEHFKIVTEELPPLQDGGKKTILSSSLFKKSLILYLGDLLFFLHIIAISSRHAVWSFIYLMEVVVSPLNSVSDIRSHFSRSREMGSLLKHKDFF